MELKSQEMRKLAPELDPLRIGTGWKREDLSKPQIFIESTYGDSHPGSGHLNILVEEVRKGVAQAGGFGARYYVTDICDGESQGTDGINFSLASREMIANMIEIQGNATVSDAGVYLASCDKGMPGNLMGLARVNIPSVVVPGGTMNAGPEMLTLEQLGMYSAKYQRGEIDEEKLDWAKCNACPSCGACSFIGTASTMQIMAEALGLALPGSALMPATSPDLLAYAREAGKQAVKLAYMENMKPSDIVTMESFENAILVHAAISGSTNCLLHIPALAHLTCASSTKEKVASVIQELKEKQIENVLALRGDIPQNADFPLPNQYKHASELIYDIKSQGDFCIGGACYPEGHPESQTLEEDLIHLKEKVDAGCEFLTTQMFFDNNILYNFMYKALKHGIDVPVVAGIMPITNANQVKRSIALSGSLVPRRFLAIVDRFGSDPAAMKQAGIAYATDQIIDLIANGVNHVHIYTMNKPDVAGAILENLSDIYVRD